MISKVPFSLHIEILYICVCVYVCVYSICVCVLVTQLCQTLCNPMDCSPPGSSVHGILQARILEWIAIFFSKGSSRPRDRAQVSCIAGRFFTIWATGEAHIQYVCIYIHTLHNFRTILLQLKKKCNLDDDGDDGNDSDNEWWSWWWW